jgi:hypothetical protein
MGEGGRDPSDEVASRVGPEEVNFGIIGNITESLDPNICMTPMPRTGSD